ncbi:hypothetical protein L596_009826 [Steinernema carpocapsae]|uniref:Uncharacterized protein n=1 Tax=Steinernema carpocapsae TaxID=34508 RepID=A0A4U5PHT3_STECR|nr:hypothetical protein L596_009826 [Steinernema carpocapsae]
MTFTECTPSPFLAKSLSRNRRGVACQLGKAGATVFFTASPPGNEQVIPKELRHLTIEAAAEEVTKRSGIGIVAYCDHSDPEQVKKLFERIDKEQNGRLDILINNAFAAVAALSKAQNPFGSKTLQSSLSTTWASPTTTSARATLLGSWFHVRRVSSLPSPP